MPIFNASSLGVGSITNLSINPQNIISDSPINCSSFYPLCNYSPCTCNLLKLYRKSTFNRFPLQATQINASSGAKVDEVLDDSPILPESPRPVRRPADWDAAKRYKETGSIYKGRVEGFNNGGLLVRFYSLVGFLPFPQLSPSHSCKEPNKTIQEIARGLIGSPMLMKVIEADEENKKLIFSEKEAMWSNYSEKIKVGDIFEARVGMVEDYGAFAHLRFPDGNYNLTGLVHVSEVSWDFVQDVRDVLSDGDDLRVKVIQIDREKSRITLSIRQLEDDPLLETLDKVIPQDGATGSEFTSTSAGNDIQPLPGLEEILKELLKEDGVCSVIMLFNLDIILRFELLEFSTTLAYKLDNPECFGRRLVHCVTLILFSSLILDMVLRPIIQDAISDVRIRRQGFEKRVVSQDLQLWLSNAPEVDNQFTILARAGRQVQEIQLTTSLNQEGIKKALQRVLERVP